MALRKFGLNYSLEIAIKEGVITIVPPFTIQFDMTRNTFSGANVCQVRVYNLSPINRNRIRKSVINYGDYKRMRLKAGYGDNLALIFQGGISQAWSVREGVDFITQIECFDGGFAFQNSVSNQTFPINTPHSTIAQSLIRDLDHIEKGAIGNYSNTLSRSNSYSGNTSELLNTVTENGFFVDKEKAYALKLNEYAPDASNSVSVINSQSGLLGTPILEVSKVTFDMLFEPRLNVGAQILLESITEESFDGLYKITAVKHRGTISESVGSSVITTGEFIYFGNLIPAVL